MNEQVTQGAALAAEGVDRWTDPAVDAVCGRFAPFWPLDAARILGHRVAWPRQYQRARLD